MGGVNFYTTEQELLELYGRPDQEYKDDSIHAAQYIWYQEGYSENYYNMILIDYMYGKMMEVNIQHCTVEPVEENCLN